MKLSLEALQVLDAIERRGSFAAAAEELDCVPSALSYQVRKLEEDLDVLLFDRRGRRARLTAAGEELLRDGRCLLDAAAELQHRVKRIASGWEPELRIAIDGLLPVALFVPLLQRFYAGSAPEGGRAPTRIRLSAEVLSGGWEAVTQGRCDLVVGAPGDAPPGASLRHRPLGEIEEVFAVAPSHPLAAASEPIATRLIGRHRAVAVADSVRDAPPRTLGLLPEQDTLTVPDQASKLAMQAAGLGCGFLPLYLAQAEARAGRLVVKRVEQAKPMQMLSLAWRAPRPGKALAWWLRALENPQDWGEQVFVRTAP